MELCLDGPLVSVEHVARAPGADRGERRLRRHHAGEHGVVAALDARHVHEAGTAADQRAAGKGEARDRLPAAFGQRARAIGDALAAFEMGGDARMRLGALKFLERVDDRDWRSRDARRSRPTPGSRRNDRGTSRRRCGHAAASPWCAARGRAVLLLRHLPQLFEADAVFLRAALGVEAEASDELLGERAARAFGEQRVLAGERDARRVAVLVRAVAGDAHVAGDDALDLAVRPEHGVGDGDARDRSRRRAPPPARRASGTGCRGCRYSSHDCSSAAASEMTGRRCRPSR